MTLNRDLVSARRFVPKFVEFLPDKDDIQEGEIWISMEHGTINLRCPCGCGEITTLTVQPSKWQVLYDGDNITIKGNPTDSIWSSHACGSHYFITKGKIRWAGEIPVGLREKYAAEEQRRLFETERLRTAEESRSRPQNAFCRVVRREIWRWPAFVLLAVAAITGWCN